MGHSDVEAALCLTVGSQPDITTTVSAYGMYMGCNVFNSITAIKAWDTWFGFKKAACVHQCLVNFF